MAKDLTSSHIHRMNILSNNYALQEIEKEVAFPGILFDGSLRYTKRQITHFYEIDERSINRYLEQHETEFKENGYEVLRDKKLNEFKQTYEQIISDLNDGKDMNVPTISDDGRDIEVASMDESIKKTSVLGVFIFVPF